MRRPFGGIALLWAAFVAFAVAMTYGLAFAFGNRGAARLAGFVIFAAGGSALFWVALKIRRMGLRAVASYPPPAYDVVAAKIAEIESEMRRIGLWQPQPLAPEQYRFQSAFAMDTMSFDQWIQFILIPRVKQIIEEKSHFPPRSEVGAQAAREFDTCPNAAELQRLLGEFDRLFGPPRVS